MPRTNQVYHSSPTNAAAKTRLDRLLALDDELQDELNKPFLEGKCVSTTKFKSGEPILSMSHGLWYDACIVRYTGERSIPSSMEPARGHVADENLRKVPLCEIQFKGWPCKYNEILPESELVSRDLSRDCFEDIFGILLAHEWNEYRREQLGLTMTQMGKGAFFLTENDLAMVEDLWQHRARTAVRFAQYAGRMAPKPKTRG
ncbi:uncharacterized protein LOC129580628 [Paramacrobiotus metropolitanus]|uniref:uncharacterized protein LOC129580628 n=1 Tax=Paramacrobiotus metropolitanus TaxID=2943436 RepID=UPI002445A7BE|nr:uncharacterized protein LOC129580628 [Paramacrobiotus metropolitanus]